VQKVDAHEGKESKGYGKEKPKQEAKRKIVPAGIRGIVRVAETDLDGTRKLRGALLKIRGIGHSLAVCLPRAVGLDPNVMLGSLNDEQISRLEAAVKNPQSVGIPVNAINRRSDPATGLTHQIVSSNLIMTQKFDIDAMKKMRCYKGIRHELGLPVRGQRTRSSFRTGMVAGVSRSKLIEAAKGAKPAAGAAPGAAPGAPAAAGAKPGAPAAVPGKPGAPAAAGAKPGAPAGAKPGAVPGKKEEKK